jgi:hypothetical protein
MINPNISLFQDQRPIQLSPQYKYIFVNDFFVADVKGGAELSSESLINYNTKDKIFSIRSHQLYENFILENLDKIFIFGNFANINGRLIPTLSTLAKYVVIEYDYKFCKYRSIEKHKFEEKTECDCEKQPLGKIIEDFYLSSQKIFWMSQRQKEIYEDKFPNLKNKKESYVLSSVFSEDTIEKLIELRNSRINTNNKFLVFNSNSWVKGTESSKNFCIQNNIPYEIVGGMSPDDFLEELSKYQGVVYQPNGSDTCPRMLIEAKILGLETFVNSNVQHTNESWYNSENIEETILYLKGRSQFFWDCLNEVYDKVTNFTLSGYTTVYNCVVNNYPYIASIKSMLEFCDELIILDGGSTDGTYEEIQKLATENSKIKLNKFVKDWTKESKQEFDGGQKARARNLANGDFCWQFDIDEIVAKNDAARIRNLIHYFPNKLDLMALPVVEFWGNKGKIRTDINFWKWRLSRNNKNITHGIPKDLRFIDGDGKLCSKPGSDSCDYIFVDSLERVPFFCDFYNNTTDYLLKKIHNKGQEIDIKIGEKYVENLKEKYPIVYHFSWYHLERKIKFFKNYWKDFWSEMYGNKLEDSAESNVMFNKKWSEVSEEDIQIAAEKFEKDLSGWIWHKKIYNEKTFGLHIQNIEFINQDLQDINKNFGDI